MTKKILLIIGILAVAGIAAFFILTSKPATEEGESRVGFSIRDYLPFGRNNDESNVFDPTANNGEDNGQTGGITDQTLNQPVPRLRKISSEPVAGAAIWNTGTTSIVRFVEKGTGNVYEVASDSVKVERLTNTTIPKVVRAFWLPDGSGFLAQTLVPDSEIIETSFVKLQKNKATSTEEILTPFSTTISKLPTGIKELSIKPDGSKIFYYTAGSVSEWFTADPDGTKATKVMTHPLTEWLPKWLSGNTVALQTKSSAGLPGFVYTFDVSSKALKKTGPGVLGLSSNMNSDGSFNLVSSSRSLPQLFLINNKTSASTPIQAGTLAEKCVWLEEKTPTAYCAVPNNLPTGKYPDDWYQGLVSTNDSIQRIDLSKDIYFNIADLSSLSNQKIDVVDINISPDESHLIFRNKVDGYLWMLRIEE